MAQGRERRGLSWAAAFMVGLGGCEAGDAGEPQGQTDGAEAGTAASGATATDPTTTTPTSTSTSTSTSPSTSTSGSTSTASSGDGLTESGSTGPGDSVTLALRFLGVGGVSLRVGDEHLITAPLYSNPDFFAVNLGSIAPDPARVAEFLEPDFVADVKAILVGHAHYDHLLDVPLVWPMTDDARVYGNTAMQWILGGFDAIPQDRIVVLNDPDAPLVDRRMCAEDDACTGVPSAVEGAWVDVPGAAIRIRALCSSHPAQFLGIIHFAEGCMEAPATEPITSASAWLEGSSLAYLVDFLDDDGAPIARVFYQDAPTDAPVGHPHPSLLEERAVDVAVLNVGSYDAVGNHPTEVIDALQPRYVVAIHWENFFQSQGDPIEPIPFVADPGPFDEAALEALGGDEDRYSRPVPGTDLVFDIPSEFR